MRTIHFLSIIVALILIVGLYQFGNTIPPKKEGLFASSTPSGAKAKANYISFIEILNSAKKGLPNKLLDKISLLENNLVSFKDSTKMIPVFDSLANIWEREHHPEIVAQYSLLSGKFGNSEKKLTFAAQLFLKLADANQNEAIRSWEALQAMFGFQQVIALNANNESAKIGLAQCYLGTGETMQGVLMLRDVVEKNPNNLEANLLLGQQGIVSGQLDKAQKRFEKVLLLSPKNVEAMLGLAEVLKGKGDKEKAIDLLNNAKKIMNTPDFSKDIDQYISTFK